MFIVLVIKKSQISNIACSTLDREEAEANFIAACAAACRLEYHISKWNEYTSEEIDQMVKDGEAVFGDTGVALIDTEMLNDVSLVDSLCEQQEV